MVSKHVLFTNNHVCLIVGEQSLFLLDEHHVWPVSAIKSLGSTCGPDGGDMKMIARGVQPLGYPQPSPETNHLEVEGSTYFHSCNEGIVYPGIHHLPGQSDICLQCQVAFPLKMQVFEGATDR